MSADDELREVFHALAGRAPDSGAVHDRISGRIARRHRARQAVAAGGAALAVSGIVAGSVVLHGAVGSHPVVAATTAATTHGPDPTTGATPTSSLATPTTPATTGPRAVKGSATSGPPQTTVAPPAELAAFGAQGYGLDDAHELARLWRAPDTGVAKAVAGRWLLDGGALPIEPGHHSSRAATSYVGGLVERFFASGHTYDDAARLARLWKAADPYTAKAVAGQMLQDGRALPGS